MCISETLCIVCIQPALGRNRHQIYTSVLWISRHLHVVTLIGENNQLGSEEFHEVDCNVMIYTYIYNICIYVLYSELKHLTNYRNRNRIDAVSSGERMR